MGKFKDFLKEDEDTLQSIYELLDEMSDEEIDDFGYFLNQEFFDDDTDENGEVIDDDEEYDIDDVKEMIEDLGGEFYDEILDMLSPIDIDFGGSEYEETEMEERVSRRLKISNMNKRSRKYMGLSKSQFRQKSMERKKKARMTRAKRKRYYNVNKKKMSAYQKSRSSAIKKGKHIVKRRMG